MTTMKRRQGSIIYRGSKKKIEDTDSPKLIIGEAKARTSNHSRRLKVYNKVGPNNNVPSIILQGE